MESRVFPLPIVLIRENSSILFNSSITQLAIKKNFKNRTPRCCRKPKKKKEEKEEKKKKKKKSPRR